MKKYLLKHIAFLLPLALFASCSDSDPDKGDPFMDMISETGSFTIDNNVDEFKITVYSNLEWFITLEFDEDDYQQYESPYEDRSPDYDPDKYGWCYIYPSKGKDDGRFYVYMDDLAIPYSRTCRIVAKDANGATLYSTELTQRGTQAYLEIDTTPLSSSSDGGSFTVQVTSNVNWTASIHPVNAGDDVSWVSLTTTTEDSQSINIDPNPGDERRLAVLRFEQTEDASLNTQLEIVQLPEYSLSNAELITVRQMLSDDYTGIIEDNVKLEVFVTSDRLTGNIDENLMYIQDHSGLGTVIQFSNVSDNIYDLDQKITVWLTGGTIRTDDFGNKIITNLATANFSTQTSSLTGSTAPAVELAGFGTIDDYPNTLVKFKGATFAVPIGTVFNGSGVDVCNKIYLTTLRGADGTHGIMRTFKSFTQKWDGGIDWSSYDITALVLPDAGETVPAPAGHRLIHEDYNHTLRLRRYSDLEPTATSNPYQPIAEWYANTTSTNDPQMWAPATGQGTFDLLDSGGTTKASRIAYCLIDPSLGYSDANSYRGYSKTGWWNSATGSAYWKFSVSGASVTGDVYLSFMVGAWTAAPRYWIVQWSADGVSWSNVAGTEFEMWNGYSATGTGDTGHLYTPQEYSFRIPGVQGLDTIHFRLIGTQNVRVSASGSTTTIAESSSSNIFFVGVYEKK